MHLAKAEPNSRQPSRFAGKLTPGVHGITPALFPLPAFAILLCIPYPMGFP